MSARTAHRRLADPLFSQQLERVRSELVERTVNMLAAAGMESVKTLVMLQGSSTPPAVRLGAARAVLDLGAKMRGVAVIEDMAEQVPEPCMMGAEQLEQYIKELQDRLYSVRRMTEAEQRMNTSIGWRVGEREGRLNHTGRMVTAGHEAGDDQ